MKTRRSFIKSVSAVSAGVALSGNKLSGNILFADGAVQSNRKIHVFSKHFHWLNYAEMAKTVKEIGFDGIDLTVRPQGHVLPERVKEDLAKAVKEIRGQGLIIDRMTTGILEPDDPYTLQILQKAVELGIKNYRMGWYEYDPVISIKENLHLLNQKLVKLAALNKMFGIRGAYQNHAGETVGGAVWDMDIMLSGIDPELLGIRYDIRHATVSGGPSWPVGLRYSAEKINSLDLKDFIWEKLDETWQPVTVPIGEGMVDFKRYLQIIHEQKIVGDFTMHFEYKLGGADLGASKLTVSPEVVISAMKRDLAIFKSWL